MDKVQVYLLITLVLDVAAFGYVLGNPDRIWTFSGSGKAIAIVFNVLLWLPIIGRVFGWW